jgi:UDP-N-acetylglucosamine--N-acetylmuramyl-(pentapeptide) pyrophosphoryl-undecaprenol N-acetylglucosamine transferase
MYQKRYRIYPYLHDEIGAALTISDLVVSRAGASSIGEYPHFGIPAILVPYPHAWRYQKVNADYLSQHGAAITLKDEELSERLIPQILELINDPVRMKAMKRSMMSLASQDAAGKIADQLMELAGQSGV